MVVIIFNYLHNMSMRKLILSMATLLVMSTGFISCNNSDDEGQDDNGISTKRTDLNNSLKYSTWQEMMDYFKDGAGVDWYGSQGLKIVSYELMGTVRVNDALLSSTSGYFYPIYNDDNQMVSISPVSGLTAEMQERYISIRKEYLSLYQGENLGVVSIRWDYNGQIITTKAYVSTSIVVYDDIMCNVYTVEIKSVSKRAPMVRRKLRKEYMSMPRTYSTDTVKRYVNGVVTAVACSSAIIGYNDSGFVVERDGYTSFDTGSKAYAGVGYIEDGEYCHLHCLAAVGSIILYIYWDDLYYITDATSTSYLNWDVHRGEVSWQTDD